MGIVEKAKKEYKSIYKKDVVNTFVKTISSNIEYSEKETNRSRIRSSYRHCCFDNADELRYRIDAEDYCTENINSVNIEMADVVSYEHYSGRGRYDRVFFTGNFMVINTNKEYERFEIRLNKFKLFNKRESLEIDNQIFNKYFKIFTDNSIEIQKYLTPYVIDFLVDFRERYGIDFEMIFEDKIYIRFYTDNMFEPKMKGKIVDEYSVYKFYVITKFVREFVEKFEI